MGIVCGNAIAIDGDTLVIGAPVCVYVHFGVSAANDKLTASDGHGSTRAMPTKRSWGSFSLALEMF